MRKRKQYRRLQEEEAMIYGVEATIYDELWQRQQWHFRYADRLRKLLKRY